MPLPSGFVGALREALGAPGVADDPSTLDAYAADALGRGHAPDLVVRPADTAQVAAVARLCQQHRVPLVVRGAGTGYTGGAVPVRGGVVLSVERLNRILEIDEVNLTAVVEPAVITGDLQRAVEARGLYYPPDPASLEVSSIGGNVAECAGGPRAFKYGTTKALRPRARSGAADRRDHPHRVEGGEERRRLRPDAAARRIGGHAGDHHAHHAAAPSVSAGARDRDRRRLPTSAARWMA
jgi:hypothetical protein